MSRKIFIWVANPAPRSLCAALADSYQSAAIAGGADVRRQNLSEMEFDARFQGYGHDAPDLEPDLKTWRDNIGWADHILIVHPYWWGAMPAMAKAVLDRALTPGFGFRYPNDTLKWTKLLTGRTADVIITSDTPPLWDTLIYGRPGRRVLKNQVLDFCGIKARSVVQFGSVKMASSAKITRWIEKAGRLGARAA